MDFNVNIPEWENEGTEPNEELIQGGFEEKYKPPANIFNWFWNRVTKAVAELQSKLSSVDNNKVDKISGKGLSTNDFTDNDKNKLSFVGKTAIDTETFAYYINTVQLLLFSNIYDIVMFVKNAKYNFGVDGKITSTVNDETKTLITDADLATHTSNTSNPHSVTKSQVGLDNVDNTSDLNKPVSTAMQTALNAKADKTAVDAKGELSQLYTISTRPTTANITATSGSGKLTHFKATSSMTTGRADYSGGHIINMDWDNGSSAESYSSQLYLPVYDSTMPIKKMQWRYAGGTEGWNNNNISKWHTLADERDLDTKADKSAVVENNDLLSQGTLNKVGWWRVAQFTGSESLTTSCELIIRKQYSTSNNEYHHVYFSGVHSNRQFSSINNLSNTQNISKCRYVSVNNIHYIDVYYDTTNANPTTILINNGKLFNTNWQAIVPEYLENQSDITGQVVYDIPANSELAQKEVVLWSGNLSLSTAHTISLNDTTDNYDYLTLDFTADNQMYCPSIKLPCKDVPNESYYEFDAWNPTNTFTVSRNGNSLYISNSGNQGKIWKIRGER